MEHTAWCEARDGLLASAAAGPATILLAGKAGTGKTLLLQEVMLALRRLGREVTLVRQGDLPFEFPAKSCLLVDEAARMDQGRLLALADQQTGLVVLAGLPNFAKQFDSCERLPAVIRLRPMEPQEVRDFARDWLTRSEESKATVTDAAIERVVIRSAGIPRLAAQMLGAALAIAGQGSVGADDVDEVADLSLCGLEADLAVPSRTRVGERPVAGAMPRPAAPWMAQATRRTWRLRTLRLAAGVAIAATILLMPIGRTGLRRETIFSAAVVPVPLPEAPAAATEVASVAAPAAAVVPLAQVVEEVRPDQAEVTPALAAQPIPGGAPPPAGSPAPEPASAGRLAMANPPPVPQDWPPVEGFHPRPAGGPGLVLVARGSDTLPQLYAQVYHGVQPPPYAEVVAANQVRVRPGAILVFPAPAEGWNRR